MPNNMVLTGSTQIPFSISFGEQARAVPMLPWLRGALAALPRCVAPAAAAALGLLLSGLDAETAIWS